MLDFDHYSMGNLFGRSEDGGEAETTDRSTDLVNHVYSYPPQSGCYFAGYFIMGGQKFMTSQPEAYLFGDNMDLNFLGPKPVPFPYLTKPPDEPTRSLSAFINIRKETLRLIKIPCIVNESNQTASIPDISVNQLQTQSNNENGSVEQLSNHLEFKELTSSSNVSKQAALSSQELISSLDSPKASQIHENSTDNHEAIQPVTSSTTNGPLYTIEFTFDSDVKCAITIYYLSLEEITSTGIIYIPRDPNYKTETFHYPKGANQIFSQQSLIFSPSSFNKNDLFYRAIDEYGNFDRTVPFPIIIQVTAEEGSETRQSHSLIATVERNSENQFHIKPFKQKIIIDGIAYLIQEVYGIENKNSGQTSVDRPSNYSDNELEDDGSKCVICMSESRDTLILHL